jgi:hypothetical protein
MGFNLAFKGSIEVFNEGPFNILPSYFGKEATQIEV